MQLTKLFIVAITAILAALIAGVSTASAQGSLPAPSNVTVRDGSNPGEVVVSWNRLSQPRFFRIGWVAYLDYEAERAAGRPWLEAFTFVDVANRNQTSRTVRYLRPGVRYAFIVASNATRYGEPVWSDWRQYTLPEDSTACPTAEPPGPPPPDPPTSSGSGDYDNDNDGLIEIANAAQLGAIRYDLDADGRADDSAYAQAFANARSGMGCPSSGCRGYELVADIDFGSLVSAKGWLPIGNSSNAFIGTFQGNLHTISNLYINRSDEDNVGLFGNIGADGVVMRARLHSVSVSGGSAVGALAGYNAGIIAGSNVTGNVSGSINVGALIGQNTGSVTDSNSSAEVTGRYVAGGLVGHNSGGKITRGHASGDVSATGRYSRTDSGRGTGGLAGYNYDGSITASYATGNVYSRGESAGGLLGRNRGIVTASYATGNVSGNYSGGLVGYNSDAGSIVAAYATGSVERGYSRGGLVARNYGTISATYSIGKLEPGGDYRGGLVARGERDLVTSSYWNTLTSTRAWSVGGEGKTTAELQSPTGATGIYADWNSDWWDFGNSGQYPVLKVAGLSVADQR